ERREDQGYNQHDEVTLAGSREAAPHECHHGSIGAQRGGKDQDLRTHPAGPPPRRRWGRRRGSLLLLPELGRGLAPVRRYAAAARLAGRTAMLLALRCKHDTSPWQIETSANGANVGLRVSRSRPPPRRPATTGRGSGPFFVSPGSL